jgi:hypothetical protein
MPSFLRSEIPTDFPVASSLSVIVINPFVFQLTILTERPLNNTILINLFSSVPDLLREIFLQAAGPLAQV